MVEAYVLDCRVVVRCTVETLMMGPPNTFILQGITAQKRLQIVLGDFIKTDVENLGAFNICISNTPYQISSRLLFKLLSLANPPRTSILMVQREFALRLLARPGDALYSRLSVNAQFFARISHVMKVVNRILCRHRKSNRA
jgi:18S rRNA (adenine1779-N6/adenine1780-N6)-dimethyltransferase